MESSSAQTTVVKSLSIRLSPEKTQVNSSRQIIDIAAFHRKVALAPPIRMRHAPNTTVFDEQLVKPCNGDKLLSWPSMMIQATTAGPPITYSVNPLQFDIDGKLYKSEKNKRSKKRKSSHSDKKKKSKKKTKKSHKVDEKNDSKPTKAKVELNFEDDPIDSDIESRDDDKPIIKAVRMPLLDDDKETDRMYRKHSSDERESEIKDSLVINDFSEAEQKQIDEKLKKTKNPILYKAIQPTLC